MNTPPTEPTELQDLRDDLALSDQPAPDEMPDATLDAAGSESEPAPARATSDADVLALFRAFRASRDIALRDRLPA